METGDVKQDKIEVGNAGLSTFGGVFTPSILTILGIILFLRLGYITGSGGIINVLLMLVIANTITIITSCSLSAIATNLRVKSGGDYYLISRTLGYRFGGSLGLVLYLAQSVSVAFYCIGFAEAMTGLFDTSLPAPLVAGIAVGLLFILAWLGADWATKFQYLVMALLIGALVSFVTGAVGMWQPSAFLANLGTPEDGAPFWVLFALFFPAVTGFTQGVSMSGDLKDPGKSLPLGTFLAVGFSILVYLGVIVLFGGALPAAELTEDYQAMRRVAKYGFLVDGGVIAATLSSAMASFMGGPRILQALAADRIFPILNVFAKGAGETNNPRRATLFTLGIALVTISLGQLNLIAQIVSMFFLISYGLLNYATYFEADIGSVSFRPTFRFFNKYVSLVGCLLCLGVLFALDMRSGGAALSSMFFIYLYLRHRGKPSRWADSSRSHAFSKVRKNLHQMSQLPGHQRDWYPHLLVFTESRENRKKILQFGDLICGDAGIMSAVQIIDGSGVAAIKRKEEVVAEMEEDIAGANVPCFSRVIYHDDFSMGMSLYLQSQGVGPLRGNTVLTNWHNSEERALTTLEMLRFGHNLRGAFRSGYNLVVFHCQEGKWQNLIKEGGAARRVDVWWKEQDDSSRLMLLFAHLVSRNHEWEDCELRVISPQPIENFKAERQAILQIFEEARIPAEPLFVDDMHADTILEVSRESSVVFLPFRIKHSRLIDTEGYSLERVLPQLPATALIMAAEEIDLDSEPEEGEAGQLAEAMDRVYDYEKRLHSSEKKQLRVEGQIEKTQKRISSAESDSSGEEDEALLARLYKDLEEMESLKEKHFRKSAKNRMKLEEAISEVEELGGSVESSESPEETE